MKKAFTMLEIVFVVIVIGVLSAIAVPKLLGTKTDAEVTKLKEQIRAINIGIQSYSKQKMLISGNMDEEENFPLSLNKNGVLLANVLSGADASKWAQDTLGGAKKDNLYTYNVKGYGKFWCVYVVNASERDRLDRDYPIVSGWNVGDFKCYQFKTSTNKLDNNVLKSLLNVERI